MNMWFAYSIEQICYAAMIITAIKVSGSLLPLLLYFVTPSWFVRDKKKEGDSDAETVAKR
jgi:hypothetical protein